MWDVRMKLAQQLDTSPEQLRLFTKNLDCWSRVKETAAVHGLQHVVVRHMITPGWLKLRLIECE